MVKVGTVVAAMVLVAGSACSDTDSSASADAGTAEPEEVQGGSEETSSPGPPPLELVHEECEESFDATGPRESRYSEYVQLLDSGAALQFTAGGGAPRIGDYSDARQDKHTLDRELLLDCILEGIDAPETVQVKLERTRSEDGVQTETVGDYELSWTGPAGLLELLIEDPTV